MTIQPRIETASSSPLPQGAAAPKRHKGKKKVVRYTMADFERPVVTAEVRMLDIDHDVLMDEATKTEIRCKGTLPYFILMANLLRASIDEYKSDPVGNAGEIDFWRGAIGHYYGSMFCEFADLIFDLDTSLEGLRRAAEEEMGLPRGTLCPSQPQHMEEQAARIGHRFSDIARDHGHLQDPAADAFFEVRRRPTRRQKSL